MNYSLVVLFFISGDSRFSFLDVNHAYFAYYQHKVGLYEKLEASPAVAANTSNNVGGKIDVDDSSQDMSLTAGVGEDSHDGSERSSDGSKNETSKPRPKPGEEFPLFLCENPFD